MPVSVNSGITQNRGVSTDGVTVNAGINGNPPLSSRQRVLMNSADSRTQRQRLEASLASNNVATGTAIGRDANTGEFIFSTSLGGTVRAKSNSNAGIPFGEQRSLQLSPDASSVFFDSQPIDEPGLNISNASQKGALFGTTNPNGNKLGRWDRDTYIRYTSSTYSEIDAIWIWDSLGKTWVEFALGDGSSGGGGATVLAGDGEPSTNIGVPGDLYVNYAQDDGGNYSTGFEAVEIYFKFPTYPNSANEDWYLIQRRAELGPPNANGIFDRQIHTTREGINYIWLSSGHKWFRASRHTHGPNPPDIKQVGDTHTVPTESGDPPTITLCTYEYDGDSWELQGCCDDCLTTAPPEEPYWSDYPAQGCLPFVDDDGRPNRPCPADSGGFVCTTYDCI